MDITTPLFNSLAWATLAAHEDAVDILSLTLPEDAAPLPVEAWDHALYAFEGIHPHWRLELQWAGDAQAEAMADFADAPWGW